MIVCKFGGSSLTSIEKLERIKNIINNDKNRKIIVVSAIGKENDLDKKVTDLLIEAYESKNDLNKLNYVLKRIELKFLNIISNNFALKQFSEEFAIFKNNFINYSKQFIISRGEYFTAKIVANFLNVKFIDSAEFMIFNQDESFNEKLSQFKFNTLSVTYPFVTTGFYGSKSNGEVTLFKRGGGDTTGAYLSHFANTKKYENYTDVNGVYNANPKFYKNAKPFKNLSFSQCALASYEGASVMQTDAIFILLKNKITTEIINLNTYKKTIISNKQNNNFKFISQPKKVKLIKLNITEKFIKNGILTNIFKVFMFNKIKILFTQKQNNTLYVITENTNKNLFYKLNKIAFFKQKKLYEIKIFSSENKLKKIKKTINKIEFIKTSYCKKHLFLYTEKLNKTNYNSVIRQI